MKFFALLLGAALVIGGACMLPSESAFSGLLLMIWGFGIVTVLFVRGLYPPIDGIEPSRSFRQQPAATSDSRITTQPFKMTTASKVSKAPQTVRLSGRKILLDGLPQLMFAGEIHYFRLKPEDWEDRIEKLKANGLDTVATYIPWLWHELPDGSVDLTGRTHPQRNLVGFIDMCHAHGLKVVARPGPFIMAELKNEGVPYRLYKEPLNIHPITWEGARVKTRTLDYLAPNFLEAAAGWYAQVMPVLAQRLVTKGGPITAIQLDNEIGMLSWVSNSPDLTDVVCEDMRSWARKRYGDDVAAKRIGADPKDPAAWAAALRKPKGAALALHHDIGLYMRDRFKRYVQALRKSAEEHGVKDVPFLINVHGTGGGRGRSFPIGISQLFESYRGQKQMTSGSDFYLGDLTTANVSDLYLANAFMAAVHDRDQPITSLEFEAGIGDYGDDLGNLYSPEGVELKTRLCVAQGNRLINYYLHAGGENPPLEAVGDGIDRIAFTGQRHGFAAPVGPDGKLNPTYFTTGRVVQSMRAVAKLLADSQEESDGFAIGFVPDHYLTEYRYPGSAERGEQIADLERFRGSGPRDMLARMLLLGGFSFPAVDLQSGVPNVPLVVLGTGKTLSAQVQRNLAQYVRNGGKLLLAGLLPDRDHDGTSCTILADALGLKDNGRLEDAHGPKGPYWPCVAAHGWMAPRPQQRVGVAQLLASTDGKPLEPLLTEVASGQPCAVHVKAGAGQAIVLGCDYPTDIELYKGMMKALGVTPRWSIDADRAGVIVTSTVSDGQRLLHLLNVAPYPVSLTLKHKGKAVFGGRQLTIAARTGLALPIGVKVDGGIIVESTAEISSFDRNGFSVRTNQKEDLIVIDTDKQVHCNGGTARRQGTRVEVTLRPSNEPVQITLD